MNLAQIKQDRANGVVLGSLTVDWLVSHAEQQEAALRANAQALADSNLALMEQTELAEKLRKQAEALEAELRVARAACDAQGELSDTYRGIALAATPPAIEAPLALSEERIVMHAVNRFLGWKLPHNFSPDNGIQFHKPEEKQFWPIGTNLFTADEAKSMFQHCLTDVVTGCAIVKVERNRVWITKGVQSFMLAYEADTSEELHWYAEQLRTILMSNHQPAAAPAIQLQEGAALESVMRYRLHEQVPGATNHKDGEFPKVEDVLAALAAPAAQVAMPDLHDQIMNMPQKRTEFRTKADRLNYAEGHRDARHAAAELAAAAAEEPEPVQPAPSFPDGYSINRAEGHGWYIDPPKGGRWVAHDGTPAADLIAALALNKQEPTA